MIYLDNNASTAVDPKVIKAMMPWFIENWANPSNGKYRYGRTAQRAIDKAGRSVAEFFGLFNHKTLFTSSATESNLSVLMSFEQPWFGNNKMFCGPLEHNSLASNFCRTSHSVIYFPTNGQGIVDIAGVKKAKISKNDCVFLQWVNSETGAINPITEISKYLQSIGCFFHIDATQAPGKVVIHSHTVPYCTSLTISAHKIYGPKGVSALLMQRNFPFLPLLNGGAGRTSNRAGTENVPGIVALGSAINLIKSEQTQICRHQSELIQNLQSKLTSLNFDCKVISPPVPQRASNTLLISWPKYLSKDILLELDRRNICVSAGSACSSEKESMSDTLERLDIDEATGLGAVRFSVGKNNTQSEIDEVVCAMEQILDDATLHW